MEALPISTVVPSSPPATAGAAAMPDPGASPAGAEGDFHAVLSRNLAGHAARAKGSASASTILPAEDCKGDLPAVQSPNLPGHASRGRGHAGASTLTATEDSKTAIAAASGANDPVDAAGDGKTADPAALSPDLAVLTANLAGHGPKGASEDGKATDDAVQDEAGKDAPTASDSTLALLAALPQATPVESRAASPAPAGRNLEGIANERAPGAGPRTAESAVTREKSARASPAESGPALRFDPDKAAERPVQGAEALPDTIPAPAPHGAHAALAAGHAPVAPLGIDVAAAGPAAAPAAPRIDTPLGAPGWSTALADRVVMFAGDKQQTAELHINPPHLGPVDISLTLSDDKASLIFASPHAIVRETIESALPRLREVLAESGINLGQASVTSDSPRDGSAQAQSRSSFGGGGGGRAGADSTPLGASILAAAQRARGLVDLFA